MPKKVYRVNFFEGLSQPKTKGIKISSHKKQKIDPPKFKNRIPLHISNKK
jgi:hypothetical protein